MIPNSFIFLCSILRISTIRLCSSRLKNTVSMLSFVFFVHVLYKLILIYIFYDLSVLPKFSVKLTVPPYILKTDNKIQINITTR